MFGLGKTVSKEEELTTELEKWKKGLIDAVTEEAESQIADKLRLMFKAFKEPADLENRVADLRKTIQDLKDELENVKLKKKIEQEDTQHLVRIAMEKNDIERQRHEMNLQLQFAAKESALQKEYHDKVMTQLAVAKQDMEKIYAQILSCMPNVNLAIKQQKVDVNGLQAVS